MIDPWTIAALTGIAVLTGFVDAIAGGGGLIMMPALLTAGVPPVNALATNKLQSIFGTAMACRTYARRGLVRVRGEGLALAMILAGSVAGALVVQRIKPTLLNLIVPVLLLSVCAYVLFSPRMSDEDAHERLSAKAYAPVGGALGFYDGFFGPGVGSFFTTSLVALRGLGLTRATAQTKLYNLTSNIAAVAVWALSGKMWWALGLFMAAGAMTGGNLGSRVAMRFGAQLIRPLLMLLSLALTGRLLFVYFAG